MRRAHDMGGRAGDGLVKPTPDGFAPYDAPWHRAALGLTLAAGGLGAWSIDESRAARERLPGYADLSYYEKWLAALADLLVAKGLVGTEELAAGSAAPAPLSPRALAADRVAGVLSRGTPYARPGPAPAFAVGARVRTRAIPGNAFVAGGHTRLPLYAAGKTGRVVLSHGAHVFPDRNGEGLGEAPEPLYTVAFRAADLWDAPEHPGDEVTADLWQSYLEPA
ncbi:MAG: nitrile hydratase subunit beta [Proteobacteria bacterium]|nr:nitrile hydratase subunit beta [Pseudomonadota bacterium]MBS0571803.1 nitrile hydratase subunit beta [Pseudomonadota bacterium]